ncbi:hypothetical protein D3C80_1875220 [compost metagenome]
MAAMGLGIARPKRQAECAQGDGQGEPGKGGSFWQRCGVEHRGDPEEKPGTGVFVLCYNSRSSALELLPDFFGSVPSIESPE